VKKRVTTYKMRELAPEIQETKDDTEAVISSGEGERPNPRKVVERSVKRERKSVRVPVPCEAESRLTEVRSEVRMLT